MENGGGATLVSYGQREGEPVDVTVVPEQHLRWMDELPTMHVDRQPVESTAQELGGSTVSDPKAQ